MEPASFWGGLCKAYVREKIWLHAFYLRIEGPLRRESTEGDSLKKNGRPQARGGVSQVLTVHGAIHLGPVLFY